MLLLGIDLGSSSIKASLVDAKSGALVASARSPERELPIDAPRPGWAEQDPAVWWTHVKRATHTVLRESGIDPQAVAGIGITYQMHGLVVVDRDHNVLRPAMIWCDGRAVAIGEKAFQELGEDFCRQHFLNSPGNFTASKLRWVNEHEPDIYKKIHKFMLPGDYIAMKLTGQISTSVSGLSEGILWDYQQEGLAQQLLDFYEIDPSLVPSAAPNFSQQGSVTGEVASELGLSAGTPVTYRAGDQPNNAWSLNVMEPGEVAATAGTSGVIYGVTDRPLYDKFSRVNTFAHVNHNSEQKRYGLLGCINGTGIQYRWLKNKLFDNRYDYKQMNRQAAEIPIGSEGVCVLPFGNGPERVLRHRDIGAHIQGVDFNRHNEVHLMRAAQEGIAFSMNYGLQVMKQMGLSVDRIRVGNDNMFQSPVFRQAFANTTGTSVELYDTNSAVGAAIGAGRGADIFGSREEAFQHLTQAATVHPDPQQQQAYRAAYERWEQVLQKELDAAMNM